MRVWEKKLLIFRTAGLYIEKFDIILKKRKKGKKVLVGD
jgi:hypothetical protein